jgi:hypothetical protein
MKRILVLLSIFLAFHSYGQTFRVNVTTTDTLVCYGGKTTFQAFIIPQTTTDFYTYKWLFKGSVLPDSTDILALNTITPADTGYYFCVVVDTNTHITDTSEGALLRMRAQLHIDTLYRYNALGCPTDSNGQMKIRVSGGNPPYTYQWSGGSFHQLDTLGVGFPKGTYHITVTDSDTSHCVIREFKIEVIKLHKITFSVTPPSDTVYLSNPLITVSIPDSAVKHLDNWNWDFGDKTPKVQNVNPCQHSYAKTGPYIVSLNFTDNVDGQLCDSTVDTSLTVKTIRLFIPNVITPGSGDDNSSLNIRELSLTDDKPSGGNLDLSEIFLSTQMFIFNRQGKRVFEKTNYKSGDWDGGNLAAGVYYYILKCHGENGDEVHKGAVTIIRH